MSKPQDSRRDIFVGCWFLLEYRTTDLNGEDMVYPLGQSPRGLLIYTEDGYMSAQLLSQSPETQPSTQFTVNDYVAYSGQFEIDQLSADGDNMRVNHFVSVASFPDWIGQVQSRVARFESFDDGERLLELKTAGPAFLAVSDDDFP